MPDATAPYHAVYHFRDEHLLELFVAKIPRSELVDPLRNSESMRNRYFRGFRISDTVPSRQQVLTAYKKEIIDRCNGNLASLLCAHWIKQHAEIASVALAFLGIPGEHAADAYGWINDVQTELEKEETIQALVQTLAEKFSAEDVLIFMSVIGYNKDQQTLRNTVDHELLQIANDFHRTKRRFTLELQGVHATIKELGQSSNELERQRDGEIAKGQAVLDSTLQEHTQIGERLAQDEASLQTLSKQLVELQTALSDQKLARDTAKSQKQQLLTVIERQRKQLASTQSTYDKRLDGVDRSLHKQSDRLTVLTNELKQVDEHIAAEEQKQSAAPPTPVAAPMASAAQLPVKNHELVGNNAICYQGIQRTFRNAIVAFLRHRLQRLYPADHVQRLKKTFGDEWDRAAQNAKQSREIYGTTTAIRDEYDLLGTNHFFGVFERFYDKLFSPEGGQPANIPAPVRPRFFGNLKAIKDGRDPLSHPVDEEIPFEEAHHLLISAKQVLNWIGCDTEATELSALAEQLAGNNGEVPSVLRRLPSEDSVYLEFVGRDALLKDLADCFANPDSRRCLLAGDGGKGKSAAAYRFAQGLSRVPDRFYLIVWLSAKRRKFREGVVTTIDSPDFTTAEEAINRLLDEYGATAQDMEKPGGEKKQLLLEFLNTYPAFIIADDIDTLLEDVDVVSLFTHEIPQTLSCVLLTSRRAIPGIRTFILQGFDTVEAEQFVKTRIQIYSLNPATFSPSIIAEIQKATDGSPLYMDDLMRLTRVVDVKSAIRIWNEKTGDEARKYALQRELEKVSEDGIKVLIAAAVTDDPISFAELQTILEFSEDRLLSALQELQTLFLFPRIPAVEGEQRYQVNLNTKKLVRLVEGQRGLYERIENVSKALAGKLPNIGHGIVSSLIRQAQLRFNADQTAEAESILLKAIEKYPNAPDLRGFLGYVYKRMGRTADARNQFEAAYKIKARNLDMFLHWINLEISEKDWSRALNVADRAIKILPDPYEIVERKVAALRQAGFDLYGGLHREKATKMWADAVDEVKLRIRSPEELAAGKRHLNASMYYTMVVCLDMLNRFRERNHWLELWEKEHPDDANVARQKEFIITKRGGLSAHP
jgi:tetratricopeptide (TPR) repeat protein